MHNNNRLIPIKDHANLSKDKFVGAIINTDIDGFQAHLKRKKEKQKLQEIIATQNSKIETLESELQEIKKALGL